MLINQENIQQRFNENLEWATEIDLATAWATIHDGLQALENHTPPLKVRAVVGLWGNSTDPEALTKLSKIGELRLVEKRGIIYLYSWRNVRRTVSAMLTECSWKTNNNHTSHWK